MKGVSATKGHLASNGGLRAHSVDSDTFPYVVVAQGGGNSGTWWRVRFPDGSYSYKLSASAHSAEVDAKALKAGLISQMTELEFASAGGYQSRPELEPFILCQFAKDIAWHLAQVN